MYHSYQHWNNRQLFSLWSNRPMSLNTIGIIVFFFIVSVLSLLLPLSLFAQTPASPTATIAQSTTDTRVLSTSSTVVISSAEDSLALESMTVSDSVAMGVPVMIHGEMLYRLYSPLGTFSPKQRADRLSDILEEYIQDDTQSLDSMQIVDGINVTTVRMGGRVIASFTNDDAAPSQRTRVEVAQENAVKIKNVIIKFRKESGLQQILINAAIAAGLTVLLFILWRTLSYLFARAAERIRGLQNRVIPSIRIKNFELLSAERSTEALVLASNGVQFVVKLILAYVYLTLVLGLFIWTRGWAANLLNFIVQPAQKLGEKFVNYLPNLFAIAVIVIAFRYILRFSTFIFQNLEQGTLTVQGFDRDWAVPTRRLVNGLLMLFAAVLIYPYSPIAESTAAQGISLFIGIVFSLGSSSLIGNLIANIILTYTRSFQIGDRIKVGDVTGDVIEKTAFVTRIRTIKNEEISIPNSNVLSANVTNYSEAVRRGDALILHTSVTIGYDVPWRLVHDLLTAAALTTDGILDAPEPFVLQTGLNDYYPVYQINAYTSRPATSAAIYSRLHAAIQDKFNEAGVEILSPAYHVHRLDNTITIPESYRAEGYQTPPIAVKVQQ